MNTVETIMTRRSCREFDLKDVEPDKIQAVLEAAIWAPSNLHSQPWRFTVTRNHDIKKKIRIIAEQTKQFLIENHNVSWLQHYAVDFLEQVPVIIAVAADPEKAGPDRYLQDKASSHLNSCCAAIQNMLLAAHSLDLGSLWFSLMDREAVKELLNIDEKMELVALVLIGYPVGGIKNIPRKPVERVTSVIP